VRLSIRHRQIFTTYGYQLVNSNVLSRYRSISIIYTAPLLIELVSGAVGSCSYLSHSSMDCIDNTIEIERAHLDILVVRVFFALMSGIQRQPETCKDASVEITVEKDVSSLSAVQRAAVKRAHGRIGCTTNCLVEVHCKRGSSVDTIFPICLSCILCRDSFNGFNFSKGLKSAHICISKRRRDHTYLSIYNVPTQLESWLT
jgi:hypothetical protein